MISLRYEKRENQYRKRDLVEQEIGEDMGGSEVTIARRTIALVAKVSNEAHVTKAMATSSKECVLYNLHTYRT